MFDMRLWKTVIASLTSVTYQFWRQITGNITSSHRAAPKRRLYSRVTMVTTVGAKWELTKHWINIERYMNM